MTFGGSFRNHVQEDICGCLAYCHVSRIMLHLWQFTAESLAHTVNYMH